VNKELKRLSFVVTLMFFALFISTSIVQVFSVDQLRADGRNVRVLYDSFSTERGPILAGGTPIAESVPSHDLFSYQRKYSHGPLYAPITGYLTLNQGNTGIEGKLNDYLSGTSNSQFFEQVKNTVTGQNPSGAAVEVTIDPAIQKAAWDALGQNSGAVIAINPQTGAILAMVSKKSYDPNLLASHNTTDVIATYNSLLSTSSTPLINRAIAGDLYHPGSVFKLIVAAAALNGGDYTPNSTFPNPHTLKLPLSSSVISNIEGGNCGGGSKASIATALRLSCNIPFAQLGAALGEERIRAMADSFGFGQKISIPMTATPSIYPVGMDKAQLMLSSFGQFDDKVTPLQMAMVSAAIANHGVLMQPTLINRILQPDLTVIQDFSPTVFSTPISQQTAATMTQMLINGVTNGAASNARISGVDVAGKTGTAENGKGQTNTLWFTGFAPAKNPQVAIAVVVENGGGLGFSGLGNTVAAPIAKKVLEAVLKR
jgi:penicillin-binding protein A